MPTALGKNRVLWIAIACISFVTPFAISALTLYHNNIPFWYDPARDFILGLENLSKPTLIGPTAGIPGIFYGPYWIWLLSVGLLVSKDPRVVVLLILAIPYFVILPLILYQFSKLFGKSVSVILWLFIAFTFVQYYATQPWNPHMAPLLFAMIIYGITFFQAGTDRLKTYSFYLVIGLLAGLVLNFHISFGIGVACGLYLFLLLETFLEYFQQKKFGKLSVDRLLIFASCTLGIVISFTPFLLFEVRHGFQQTQVAIKTLTAPGAVVAQIGLDKGDILLEFINKFSSLLFLKPPYIFILIGIMIVAIGIGLKKRKIIFTSPETKLLLFLLSVTLSILFLYINSKNPVWAYHFIGVEMIFLFLLGLLMSKFRIIKYIFVVWVIIFVILQVKELSVSMRDDPVATSSLATKKHVVQLIDKDAANKDYAVFSYNPSIYMYDYAYLFQWLTENEMSYRPEEIKQDAKRVYLIIPNGTEMSKREDFIHFRSPEHLYMTTRTWTIPDGTVIVKREIK